MGGVVRYTEQMALTGDTLAKNGPLGCALQRAGPRQEGWGWGYIRTDSPSVNRRQSYLCQPLLLQRSTEVGEGQKEKGTGVLRHGGKNRQNSNGKTKSFWTK